MPHDVFISYGREDSEMMRQVDQALHQAGLTTWTDHGIHPGSPSWKVEIETAIRDARCIVVLFSPDSAESRWVRAELDYAEAQHKPIYPLLVRGDKSNAVPFGFTSYQWIDLRDPNQLSVGLEQLVAVLKGDKATLPETAATPVTSSPTQARTMIPIALGMIAAGLILGVVLLISIPKTAPDTTPTAASGGEQVLPTALPTMPPFSVPDGFKKLEGERTIMAVPEIWSTDVDPIVISETLNTIAGANKTTEDLAQSVLSGLDTIAIYMFQFQSAAVSIENVGIGLPYSVIEARQRAIFQQAVPSGTFASRGTVEMPAGTMLVSEAYDGSIYLLDYALLRGTDIYNIYFNGRFADKEIVNSNAEQIVATFRVKE